MTHIATLSGYRYPWYVRLIFRLQRGKYGQVLEPARLWGRTPRVFLAMSAMYGALDRKSLPCRPPCASAEQLAVRGQFLQSPLFNMEEKAALEYAEAMTDSNQRSDAALIARLRQHFSDDAIIELTALIAFQNMSSKFNTALGVPSQEFCERANRPLEPSAR